MDNQKIKAYNIRYLLLICGIAALGGLLFGYDTAVISGAVNPISRYFELTPFETGWAVSNVAIGCIVGALTSGWLAGRLGRKKTLILSAVLFTISAVGAAVATTFFSFIVYRLIGGLAVGIASSVSPMYMSEVSPKSIRGRAVGMQNFAIVFGQVVIFFGNFMIAKGAATEWIDTVGWRIMIGSEVIPCALFCMVVFLIPESPRWLVMQGKQKRAHKILKKIGGEAYADKELEAIERSIEEQQECKQHQSRASDLLRESRFWLVAVIACMIAVFQQASGVNVMMYFAPVLLEGVTGDAETALFMTIWIGVIQLVGTAIGSFMMDRVGRVPLLRIGSLGCILGLLITSYFLYESGQVGAESATLYGYLTLMGMLIFMVFFSFSWALGAWIIVSEIFPNRMRSLGMSIAVTTLWVSNFLISLLFPILNENTYLVENFNGAAPMWLFAGIMMCAYWFVGRFLPETKGVSLEKMEQILVEKVHGKKAWKKSIQSSKRMVAK